LISNLNDGKNEDDEINSIELDLTRLSLSIKNLLKKVFHKYEISIIDSIAKINEMKLKKTNSNPIHLEMCLSLLRIHLEMISYNLALIA
jgi:hypothetical protein